MSIANDLIFLSLRNAGVNGIGQTPLYEDVNDSFKILNAWVNQLNLERTVMANRIALPTFPDLVTDIAFWTPYEHVVLTSMAVRLREIYALPAVELDVKIAQEALQAFQAINQQQIAPLYPGIPATVQQVIFLALRMAGRITDQQSVADNSKDVNDAFALFAMMVGQWQRKRWLTYALQETSVAASTGALSYTIGPGEDFDCARPVQIKAAYIRILNSPGPTTVDIPLEVVAAREDYAAISVKNLETMPAICWLETQWPTAQVHFWPVPPAGMYGLFLETQVPLPTYVAITDPLGLPDEYTEALVTNLACRVALASGQVPPQLVIAARMALNTIRQANVQIPELAMPMNWRHSADLSLVGRGLGRAFVLDQGAVLG